MINSERAWIEKTAKPEKPVHIVIKDQKTATLLQDMFVNSFERFAKRNAVRNGRYDWSNEISWEYKGKEPVYRPVGNAEKLSIQFDMSEKDMSLMYKFLDANHFHYQVLTYIGGTKSLDFMDENATSKLAVAGFNFDGADRLRIENMMRDTLQQKSAGQSRGTKSEIKNSANDK